LDLILWSSELGESASTSVNYEAQVGSATFLVEKEDLLVSVAEPVEELEASFNELEVFQATVGCCILVIVPNNPNNFDENTTASLQCFDPCKFWNCTLVVEVLHPTS